MTCTEGFPFVVCSPVPSHWVANRRLLVLYCNKRHTKWIASTCTRAQIKDPERVTSISMLQPYILVVASFGSLICAREREKKKGRIHSVPGLKGSVISITRIGLPHHICFNGFCSPYMFSSFHHAMGSWTADPQGSFPIFPVFCSPISHGKGVDLSNFYCHPRV